MSANGFASALKLHIVSLTGARPWPRIRVCPRQRTEKELPLQVLVRDNNIDQLKKKMQREGAFREMKQRRSYEKPSERRNREKSEAIRRARKLARKKAQREGLTMPKKKQVDNNRSQRPAVGAHRGVRGGHLGPPRF
jgi:small subunit ribosomal protein S21